MNYFYDQVSVALCWAVVRRLLVALPAGAGAVDKIRSGCVCTEWMGVCGGGDFLVQSESAVFYGHST